jgi:hypothetical protein
MTLLTGGCARCGAGGLNRGSGDPDFDSPPKALDFGL